MSNMPPVPFIVQSLTDQSDSTSTTTTTVEHHFAPLIHSSSIENQTITSIQNQSIVNLSIENQPIPVPFTSPSPLPLNPASLDHLPEPLRRILEPREVIKAHDRVVFPPETWEKTIEGLPVWVVGRPTNLALYNSPESRDPNKEHNKNIKDSIFAQYLSVYPRVLDMIASGSTLTEALNELPIQIDHGAYMRWITKDHERNEQYKESKELRTEAWAGRMVKYSEASDTAEDVSRSRLKVDTLKWLMESDNRKTYGSVKQLEIGGSISITSALKAANERVINGAEYAVIDSLTDKDD